MKVKHKILNGIFYQGVSMEYVGTPPLDFHHTQWNFQLIKKFRKLNGHSLNISCNLF
jgi:hypothetical protein